MTVKPDGIEPVAAKKGTSPSTLSSEVYESLLDALIEGRLQPGDRLVMDRLALEMNVSRTPVRDALHRLFSEGIIEPAGRRGYLVRESSARDTNDFYAARIAVEGDASAHLAIAASDTLKGLRTLLEQIASAPCTSTRQSFEINRHFHRSIVASTGNGYLLDMFDAIWSRSRTALTYRQFAAANPAQDFECEHKILLDAIEDADPDGARRAMLAHIRSGLDRTHTTAETTVDWNKEVT